MQDPGHDVTRGKTTRRERIDACEISVWQTRISMNHSSPVESTRTYPKDTLRLTPPSAASPVTESASLCVPDFGGL